MIRVWRAWRDRLGRRGSMLILLGVTYLILAVGHLIRFDRPISGAFHSLMPDWVNGVLWGGAGILAIIFAWRKHDGLGWVGLYLAPMIRIVSYLGSWVFYLFPGGVAGYVNGWYSAAVYTPIVFCVLICSGWREPSGPIDPIMLDEVDHATPNVAIGESALDDIKDDD